jgi:hypothetical protein
VPASYASFSCEPHLCPYRPYFELLLLLATPAFNTLCSKSVA